MKAFYDFFSIFVFFIVYKHDGFYTATLAINALLCIGVLLNRVIYGYYDKLQLAILACVACLSIPTLLLHEEIFFKWKPTLISWLFSGIFWVTPQVGEKKTLLEKAFAKEEIILPKRLCLILNYLWTIYFLVLGGVNIIIAYYCTTDTWVNFKLFGTLGTSIFMMLVTMVFLWPELKRQQSQKS